MTKSRVHLLICLIILEPGGAHEPQKTRSIEPLVDAISIRSLKFLLTMGTVTQTHLAGLLCRSLM